MKILVINGPNLNMLGIREPDIYGKQNFAALEEFIKSSAGELGLQVSLFQSNHEGEIVDVIQSAYGVFDGIATCSRRVLGAFSRRKMSLAISALLSA